MAGKFKMIKDKSGQFRFRYHAGNGEILMESEPYSTKIGCKNGIASVQKNAPSAKIVDQTE